MIFWTTQKTNIPYGLDLTLLTVILLMQTLSPVTGSVTVRYELGESGTKGREVMATLPELETRVACAGACNTLNGCLGFNWMPRSEQTKCQLLSGLRRVATDPNCDLYVPDTNPITAIELAFSCPICMLATALPGSVYDHRCPAHQVAVGLTATNNQNDVDYLLCAPKEGLQVGLEHGRVCTNDLENCRRVNNGLSLPDSITSSDQYYNQPLIFSMVCRPILSSHKVDYTRCLSASWREGYITGISQGQKVLKCPPHMTAMRLYVSPLKPAEVDCCLLY